MKSTKIARVSIAGLLLSTFVYAAGPIPYDSTKCPNGECLNNINNAFEQLRGNLRPQTVRMIELDKLIDAPIKKIAEIYAKKFLADSSEELHAEYLTLVNSIFTIHRASVQIPNLPRDPEMQKALAVALAEARLIAMSYEDWTIIEQRLDDGRIIYLLKPPGTKLTRAITLSLVQAIEALEQDRNLIWNGQQGAILKRMKDAGQAILKLPEDIVDSDHALSDLAVQVIEAFDEGYFGGKGAVLKEMDLRITEDREKYPESYLNLVQFRFYVANLKEHKNYGVNFNKMTSVEAAFDLSPQPSENTATNAPSSKGTVLAPVEIPVAPKNNSETNSVQINIEGKK